MMIRFSRILGSLLIASLIVSPAAAKFRKCTVKIMVSAQDMPETEVEGARFVAWGRSKNYASVAWNFVNRAAKSCAVQLAARDTNAAPGACAANQEWLDNSAYKNVSGVTGLQTTHVKTLVKQTICRHHPRPNSGVEDYFKTREVQGLYVTVRHIGPAGACKTQRVSGPNFVKIRCARSDAADTDAMWHLK